ncbi:MAG: DUF2779 domain-containing protein [Pelolinea sp.]|nr:DUF2779 domain-containing protein [Pelolinea sp.]
MSTSNHLTKSDFLLYLDAPLHLWAAKHDRIETSPSPFNVHLMDQGYEVEQLAKQYILSVLINPLNEETLHWQSTYSYQNYTVRTDALVEKPHEGSFDLYEIKSGTGVQKENILDAVFQYLILSKQLNMDKIFILHLNKDYVRDGDLDIPQLFTADDITQDVLEKSAEVEAALPLAWAAAQSETMGTIPHCLKPNTCPCPSLCHPDLPDNSIYNIPRLSVKKKMQLLEQGILMIQDIPIDFELSDIQRQIVDVVCSNTEFIDADGIRQEFQDFEFPLYFLDYESCLTAVPLYYGYHPQQQMVFQYSLHKMKSPDDDLIHSDYLADTKGDPSASLVRHLRDDIGDTGTIFVWNKSFEMTRHKELAVIHPEYAQFLTDLNERVYDLGEFVSKGLYLHPNFKGSWSIKNILPVMVPDLSYENLEVNKGDQAAVVWWDMITGNLSPEEVESTKTALLTYCEMDTWAMVRIWQKLREYC